MGIRDDILRRDQEYQTKEASDNAEHLTRVRKNRARDAARMAQAMINPDEPMSLDEKLGTAEIDGLVFTIVEQQHSGTALGLYVDCARCSDSYYAEVYRLADIAVVIRNGMQVNGNHRCPEPEPDPESVIDDSELLPVIQTPGEMLEAMFRTIARDEIERWSDGRENYDTDLGW